MIFAKEPLIKKALGTDDLRIFLTPNSLKFPWFSFDPADEDAAYAYSLFISSLVETAKKKKRVTAQPTQTDNPRFSMRVWLISLGMVGDEFALIRKLMLNNLVGESGWRFGRPDSAEARPRAPKPKAGRNPAITGDILEQIVYINKNNEANMLDIREVGEFADGYGFFQLNRLIKTDPRAYLTFILAGGHE